MARKSPARPGKNARPRAKNSPTGTPRRKPDRKIELKATPQPAPPPIQGRPYPVVGVGASAGGFEAFREQIGRAHV